MTVQTLLPEQFPALIDLLVPYFREVEAGIPEDIIRGKLAELIAREVREGILHIAVATEAEILGFSVYQIDTEASDWCKRPGWGMIREFYVVPTARRRGIGRMLSDFSTAHLLRLGAAGLYLTSDPHSVQFWTSCGFRPTGTVSSNGLEILEK